MKLCPLRIKRIFYNVLLWLGLQPNFLFNCNELLLHSSIWWFFFWGEISCCTLKHRGVQGVLKGPLVSILNFFEFFITNHSCHPKKQTHCPAQDTSPADLFVNFIFLNRVFSFASRSLPKDNTLKIGFPIGKNEKKKQLQNSIEIDLRWNISCIADDGMAVYQHQEQ